MKSEDKIIKALTVLDEMCEREKSLVNKFIVADMSKSLRASFNDMQNTLDAQCNHTEEQQSNAEEVIESIKIMLAEVGGCDAEDEFHKGHDSAVDEMELWMIENIPNFKQEK